ncbi:hypothetical protein [Pararhodobacter aggregans]|uniref:Lipoprotein n=1 Tax=Pararhodobacter aggregans TaxID=404875 RepID=A0A2T7UUW8_9RHOB|nr:hypothetical protein [Pararhodobacter aggregans]PTX04011.1 hypothetical protein C8N33_102286 [Pararhodobacter aggregans]PVE48517.1 hypothetical protein DDE23_05540 [Pararhodobacter aggregans]
MTRAIWITAALAAATALAGCGDIPDMRFGQGGGRPAYGGGYGGTPVVPSEPVVAGPSASQAEGACMSAGREAGFDVQGVVGTREQGTSRDVMLRVQRGGQTVEVRCSYAYDSGQARIMTL